jgi:hypothetical protein
MNRTRISKSHSVHGTQMVNMPSGGGIFTFALP